ncbi:MAG: hypothetical protein ACRERC_06295 [Candidatus Binatia bacterium]
MKRGSIVAALALLGLASSASAVIITGGPTYTPPNGGSCSVSGDPKGPTGGLWTCTAPLASYTNLYIGIKNNNVPVGTTPIGLAMRTNTQPTGAEIVSWSAEAGLTITYTGQTAVFNVETGANQTVFTRQRLVFSTGSAAIVDDASTIALTNANGAVHSLFRVLSGSFVVTTFLEASDAVGGPWTNSRDYFGTASVHGKNTRTGTDRDVSHVDLGFYYSTCGDSTVDTVGGTPEQCDQGSGVNGTLASCCSATCGFKTAGTACTDDGNVCSTDTCNGSSVVCQHPAGNAGFTCRASVGVCDLTELCTGASTTCPGDAKSTAVCRGSAGVCDLVDSCNGVSNTCPADAKSTAVCRPSAGVCDVTDSCNGVADTCPVDIKSTAVCRPAVGICDVAEVCDGLADTCDADALRPNGFVCNAGSGDACDPDEQCDGSTTPCPSDTITSPGTQCRAGSGDSCDPDEQCTGVADQTCPPDVVLSAATVCLAGSGDSCDPDELCTGVAGQPCPADVVTPAATECRPGSGDLCDPTEACTGVAGEACPADVLEANTTLCRPGSGDVCDPDEFCPGLSAGSCAAEIVAPPTTTCRGPAGSCDATEQCTGTPGATCPADGKLPAGTECRAAAHNCDVAEECSGASDTCPADDLAPDGTSCPDGLFCNGAETCQSGTCVDAADPCILADICNESSDICQTDACPATPQTCRTAVKSLLLIKNNADDNKDRIIWKYIKGQPTVKADFANPMVAADYALCIYAGASPTLVGTVHVAPSATKWRENSKGYKYKDTTFASDGTQKVLAQGTGESGRTKALLVARGTGAPDVLNMGALQTPVTAQLYNYQTGLCWQGTYASPIKNTATGFKGKQ